jgi:hypothetical protein
MCHRVARAGVEFRAVLRSFALPAVLLALAPFHSSSRPLPSPVRSQLEAGGFWHKGCPVARSDLRLLTVSYRGCGQSRDPATRPFFDRSRHRRGMVGPRAVRAFAAAGWGWGGSWAGNTKDYMHFSSTGH